MNIDLIQTLVRSLMKIGSGVLAAKGYGDDSNWEVVTAGVLAIVSIVWGAMHRTGKTAADTAKVAPLIMLLVLPAFGVMGCQTTLQSGGAYNGDYALYNADLTISTSYELIHSFVSWEYANRELLKRTPQLKEFADHVRLNYPNWHRAAMSCRNAYALSKSKTDHTALQMSLDVLREAAHQANQWFANAAVSPLATN